MENERTERDGVRWWLWALVGPGALGAVIGIRGSAWSTLGLSTLLPAVVVGVAALVVPSLYVVGAFAGVDAPAARFAAGVKSSLLALGLVVLGLVPAVLVVAATLPDEGDAALVGQVLGGAVLAVAALMAVSTLERHLAPQGVGRAVFATWAVLGMGLGLRMYVGALDAGWGW